MTNAGRLYPPVEGKTYSLFAEGDDPQLFFTKIKCLTDMFLELCPDEQRLMELIREAGRNPLLYGLKTGGAHLKTLRFIRETLRKSLSIYTRNVSQHLKSLSFAGRFDATLSTTEEKYHLYMIEIELINRIHVEAFKRSEYKFALIAHCLRDFREGCRSEKCDMEAMCSGCTDDCVVRLGSVLLERFGVKAYISVEREQAKLFRRLKQEHPSIGALGIACIPELARGMRLCIRVGISPIGVQLNANRCARWMSRAHPTSFSLGQLEKLLA